MPEPRRRRWRDYQTPAGRRPVKAFITELHDVDAASVIAAMKDVATEGLAVARHLRGDIYEVRADGERTSESDRARREAPQRLAQAIAEVRSRMRYGRMTAEMAKAKDFIDELVDERTAQNPDFPQLVEAALRTRRLVRALAERRRAMGISQTVVAARMGTSQSALARLEAGGSDPRISTVERYARALGEELEIRAASSTG